MMEAQYKSSFVKGRAKSMLRLIRLPEQVFMQQIPTDTIFASQLHHSHTQHTQSYRYLINLLAQLALGCNCWVFKTPSGNTWAT
jgi:hypothetical protein